MRIIATSVFSYLVGFLSYTLALKFIWDQSLAGDAYFVLVWGAIAFFLVACPIYVWIIHLIDKIPNRKKFWHYPLGCMLVFFLPTSLISLRFGSANLFSPESMLFHAFFLSSGLVFGLITWKLRHSSAPS